jgi:sodium/potassium-transporting ATPase subunit alpha
MSYFGMITEVMLTMVVAFLIPFNIGFGTRDNIFVHFGTMAIPFALIDFCID